MTDTLHSVRLPGRLLESYREVIGSRGMTADLKTVFDWYAENPGILLGDDVERPYDDMISFRIEDARWAVFIESLDGIDYSSVVRRYLNWRIQHPQLPLPGRRIPPLRRDGTARRPLACV